MRLQPDSSRHLCLLSLDESGLRTAYLLGTIAQENESLEAANDLFKLIFLILLMRENNILVKGVKKNEALLMSTEG